MLGCGKGIWEGRSRRCGGPQSTVSGTVLETALTGTPSADALNSVGGPDADVSALDSWCEWGSGFPSQLLGPGSGSSRGI